MRGFTLALAALLLAPLAGAQTYNGLLDKTDQTLNSGEYVDSYTISVSAGQTLVVDLRSSAFDPYLIVKSPSDDQTDNDDWEGDPSHSRVEIPAAEGGIWEVLVTSYEVGETGAYTLRLGASGGSDRSDAALAELIRRVSNGGSQDWKQTVGLLLTASSLDRNGSGAIDGREVNDIGCEVWRAIEEGYAQGEYDRFWVGYGFKPDLIWNAESLGFSEGARAPAWAAIQRCIPNAN